MCAQKTARDDRRRGRQLQGGGAWDVEWRFVSGDFTSPARVRPNELTAEDAIPLGLVVGELLGLRHFAEVGR